MLTETDPGAATITSPVRHTQGVWPLQTELALDVRSGNSDEALGDSDAHYTLPSL